MNAIVNLKFLIFILNINQNDRACGLGNHFRFSPSHDMTGSTVSLSAAACDNLDGCAGFNFISAGQSYTLLTNVTDHVSDRIGLYDFYEKKIIKISL
jgi:hypothetical protein